MGKFSAIIIILWKPTWKNNNQAERNTPKTDGGATIEIYFASF